jgi:3-methyl-2-oxobutanoate hydroxymethyltransferase
LAYGVLTVAYAEAAIMDRILVGDSMEMCVYGLAGTLPVTMDMGIVDDAYTRSRALRENPIEKKGPRGEYHDS